MPASIGVNLRVTGHCSQGGRKYMEDLFSVAYQQTEDERDLEYAFFGIYDGHGGSEAAAFAKEHLMDSIVKQRQFWSDNDEDVLKAIRNGYMLTHLNMWKELEKWPKTVTGLPSTAGTTASIAFIRRGKIYIGHVGDSAIVLGYQKDGSEEWAAKPLTSDHKPESTVEIERIQRCGGKVVSKAGVPRVVWNRPRPGHKGPIKKNTPLDEIPFLAVARSLGDLWSYNPNNDEFIVSPDPDVGVLTIDPSKFRCLIFGTDGLWNMISPEGAVSLVQATEKHNEAALVGGAAPIANQTRDWLNPSKSLVDHALERWSNTRMRADNTSVVTLMLDPPGPPRATVLRSRSAQKPQTTSTTPPAATAPAKSEETKPESPEADSRTVPQNGLTIMTRYADGAGDAPAPLPSLPPCASLDGRFTTTTDKDEDTLSTYGNPAESYFMARLLTRTRLVNTLSEVYDEIVSGRSPSPAPGETELPGDLERSVVESPPRPETATESDPGIQINEVSSSSPVEIPRRPRRPRETRAAPHDRVLRSHDPPPRPATRARAAPTPAPAERVVILSRRAPPPAERVVVLNRRVPPPEPRRTRSSAPPAPVPAPASGNAARAPAGPRRTPARRSADCSKENLPARRARPPAGDARPPALRSRNEAAPAKRARADDEPRAAGDKPRPAADKPRPALAKRAAAWAPALALRDRLRRRLAK